MITRKDDGVRLSPDEARARFAAARVARLATVRPDGSPHLVPITFVVAGDMVFSAVDAKPKRTVELQRLTNISANREVCLLADEYADDWTQLWWARADGTARIVDDERAQQLLAAKYPQYVSEPPPGPVLAMDVARWSGWAASDPLPG